ncbi:MAG TPA: hypothetical protein VJ873_10810, partial [bacterium]|nr:hypothetical protein [bacterium]
KNHGDFYFEPPLFQWKEEALRNRERLVKETFWGQSPLKVRAELKLPTHQPLILSGHQPVFFHPGHWAKCLAASTLAEAVQGTACHKVTDTALGPEYLHYMPEVEEDGHGRKKILEFYTNKDLKQQERTTPYCFLPAPDHAALEKILKDAEVYAPAIVKANIKTYQDKLLKEIKKEATWNDFHLSMAKILDDICGTRRLYLEAHKIWETQPYYRFLSQWLLNLPELNDDYNQALNEYRKKHGITHDLTPMPNLKFEDWWFEIPFWGVARNQRHSLWAKNDGKHIVLKIKGGDGNYSLAVDELETELSVLNLSIWPKAIPQTLFCRMYLCDFFIHGTGGAVYEEVGDMLFSKFFKVKPLSFGVATATFLVDPEGSKGMDAVMSHEERIQWWDRALSKNPEYLFTKKEVWEKELPSFIQAGFKKCLNNPYLRNLAETKVKWLGALQNPTYKSEASYKIKEINHVLYEGLTEAIQALEKGLLDIEKVKQPKEVMSFREYPFFCYPPEVFTEMRDKIRELAHHEETAAGNKATQTVTPGL